MIGFWDGSGISWTIRKQSAPRCRQITTPTPYHSIFTGQVLFLMPNQQCQSTEGSSLYRENLIKEQAFCCKSKAAQSNQSQASGVFFNLFLLGWVILDQRSY